MPFVRRLLWGMLVLLVLSALLLGWLAGTASGTRLLWGKLIAPRVPELAIGRVEGRLADSLRLTDVRYANDLLSFTARTLELDWSPAALFEHRLQVTRLSGTDVRYEQRAAGEDGGPVSLPARFALPLNIEVDALSVQELAVIGSPGADPLVFDSIGLAGTYRDTELALTRVAVHQAAFTVGGSLTLHTRDDFPLAGALDWQATPPGYAPITARAELTGTLRALHVVQTTAAPYALRLDLTLRELLADATLDGTASLADSDLTAINASWPDMRLAGSVHAQGPFSALVLDGALDVQDPRAGALRLRLAGMLLPDALRFDTLQLAAADGPARLEGQGTLGFGARPVFDFQAQWQSLTWPLSGPPDYASRAGRFSLTGTADAYTLDAAGDLRLRDLLNGDLTLQARSAESPGNWRIEAARLSAGESRVQASGQVGRVYDLAFRVDAPRLGDLLPGATGQLDGRGTLTGSLTEPALTLRATGAGLAWRDYRSDVLDVDAALDPAASSRLAARLEGVRLPGMTIAQAVVRGSGTRAAHQARLEAVTDQGNTDLEVNGQWDGARWRFDLRSARVERPPLAPWRLLRPVSGELARDGLRLPAHCWGSGAARACGNFTGSAEAFSATATLTELPLTYLAEFFPEQVSLQGELGGHGEFRRERGTAATVELAFDSTPLQIGLPGADGAAQQQFRFSPAHAAFTLGQGQAALTAELPFVDGSGGLKARADLALPADGDWQQGRLQGELGLEWPDIGLAARWIPEIAELRGRIDGRMQLDGSPAAPHLQGSVVLSEGAATLVTPGVSLQNVSIELTGQPAGDVRIAAVATSGGGTLRADGLASPVGRSATLALRGTDFQVMNTAEAKIHASPDLELVVNPEGANITGRIDVPRAQLRPRRPPPSAVSVSADEVIVTGEETDAVAARYPVTARVRIALGDAVDIDGLGLSGKLRGDVQVTELPGQPATASGELSIHEGRYEAYGQKLEIRTGRLLFAGGAVTAPGVDIEAVRKPAPDVTVGVKARGPLRAPEFTVFSEPTMPQSQQMSWLVLGRPLEGGASDSERSAMQTAALLLGLSRGESIGQRIGETLGLDEVSIEREAGADVTQASLLVGKYLTPELFVSYGVGLFEPVATLRLRYALSSHWKLVGQAAAAGSSADLFYEIERRK